MNLPLFIPVQFKFHNTGLKKSQCPIQKKLLCANIGGRSKIGEPPLTFDEGPDFDDKSSLFPCEIDHGIQYINLGYGAQAPKIVIL